MRQESKEYFEERVLIVPPDEGVEDWHGAYLLPALIVYPEASHEEICTPKFWHESQKYLGTPVWAKQISFNLKIQRDQETIECIIDQIVYMSMDGLLATQIPAAAATQQQAALYLSKVFSFVTGLLNLGGFFFRNIKEDEIFSVSFSDKNGFVQCDALKDRFSNTVDNRSSWRRLIPLEESGSGRYRIVDYPYILSPWEVERYYLQGLDACEKTGLTSGQVGIALDAVQNFTYRDWNGTLLAAWIFIESIIDLFLKNQQRSPELKNIYSKLNFLVENELIDIKFGKQLHIYRECRNNLVHEGINVDRSSIEHILPSITKLGKCLFQADLYTNRQGGIKPGVSSHLPWE